MTDYDSVVSGNLGLVHACCRRCKDRGVEYDDLYSAGCLGLVKAVRGFNPELGLKLSTYAVPVILGEIKRLFRDGGTVKVSRSLKELSIKIKRFSTEFQLKNGREPSVNEIAEGLNENVEKINDALNSSRIPLSLTADSDDERAVDIPTEDIAEKLTEKLALRDVIKTLEIGDRKIIELRYYQHKTQSKTAEALGMTQVQISRREKKILMLLRQKLG
ncbi:MAG: sigma-70 family RNA polymerase sigma factor [Ruminococcus sp.]|nr:sigma-70 family RNA polymerase sigma factor [Ruminococcus sp.]